MINVLVTHVRISSELCVWILGLSAWTNAKYVITGLDCKNSLVLNLHLFLRLFWCAVYDKVDVPLFQCPSKHGSVHGQKSNWSQSVNTLRPKQNCCHFADDNLLKYIFFYENVWISFKISLTCVVRVPINNIPVLVHIMAWRLPGNNPLSEPMMVSLLMHICVTRPLWVKPMNTWKCMGVYSAM